MKLRTCVPAAVVLLIASTFAAGAPPKVVKAVPDDGDKDVDAAKTREIRVTFDQPMDTSGGWSIVGGGETFPKLVGRPKWVDERTLMIRVKLQPGRDYWLSFNNANFTNFRSKAGEAAVPYPVEFSTKAGPAPDAASDNKIAVEILREAIDGYYAHRDKKKLDWSKFFEQHGPEMEAAKTPDEFARAAAK